MTAKRPATGEKLAAIRRKNGAKGGRPKGALPPDVIERMGKPPEGALALSRWHSRLLAEVGYLQMTGKIDRGLASEIRATCSAGGRMISPDVLNDVDRLLRGDQEQMSTDDVGPEVENVRRTSTAIRRDPK